MAALTEGTPLPNISSTTAQTTTAPQFYTNALNQIATQGMDVAKNAQYVGPTELQQQAFQKVGQNVGNYQPALTEAQGALTQAGGVNIPTAAQPYMSSAALPSYQNIQDYMNPYTQDVVNKIGALGQQNIAQTLAPQTTAGIVGAGQFGSQRGAEALAQNIANAGLGITAQQSQALQSGYQNAMSAAQADAARQAQLAQIAGNQAGTQGQLDLSRATTGQNLASTTQNLGLGDVNALSTLGAQQQTIGQNQQLFPLQTLTTAANALKGFNVPTNVSSTYTGPGQAGQYSPSTLSTIAGMGSLLAGVSNTNLGKQLFGTATTKDASGNTVYGTSGLIGDWLSKLGSSSTPSGAYTPNIPSAQSGPSTNASNWSLDNPPPDAAQWDPFSNVWLDQNGEPIV
jgi:hypothetical protein